MLTRKSKEVLHKLIPNCEDHFYHCSWLLISGCRILLWTVFPFCCGMGQGVEEGHGVCHAHFRRRSLKFGFVAGFVHSDFQIHEFGRTETAMDIPMDPGTFRRRQFIKWFLILNCLGEDKLTEDFTDAYLSVRPLQRKNARTVQ